MRHDEGLGAGCICRRLAYSQQRQHILRQGLLLRRIEGAGNSGGTDLVHAYSRSLNLCYSAAGDLRFEHFTLIAPRQTADGVDLRALIAIQLGVALASLDTAIANTALPTIAADLQASPASSIWVINAYQLAIVSTLLPFAALGDLLGPRRVFLAGLAFFTLASLGCAFASTLPALAAARALQGIGASGVMSVNIALIRLIFPATRLGRGVGLNALVVGVSFAVGPTIASLVLSVASWPWLFAINVPLGMVALAFALPALPHSTARSHRFDWLTALLTALSFASLVLALGAAAQREPISLVLMPLGAALIAFALLLWRQAGHRRKAGARTAVDQTRSTAKPAHTARVESARTGCQQRCAAPSSDGTRPFTSALFSLGPGTGAWRCRHWPGDLPDAQKTGASL